MTYDKVDNLIKETDSLGRVTSYEYDLLHHMTKSVDAEGGVSVYSYDAYGNLTSEADPLIKKKVEQIMIYGEMTEAETVIYNATSQGKYPENVNIDSISWLFTATSFYMSENEFVIMPGAKYYSPIPFSWDEIEGIVKNPYDLNQE